MANEYQESLTLRLWRLLARPQTLGWFLLASGLLALLLAASPSAGTQLLVRVSAVLAGLSALVVVIEHARADRGAVWSLARAGVLRGVVAPFFRQEFRNAPERSPRLSVLASVGLVAVVALSAAILLALGAFETRAQGEVTILPGASTEAWTEVAPQPGIARALGTQLTLLRAGVREGTPQAELLLTDPVSQARVQQTLRIGESARVDDQIVTLSSIRPLGGLGEVVLNVAQGDAEPEQVSLVRDGETSLSDGTTLRWLGAEANHLQSLGAAVLVEFDPPQARAFRRWLYAADPDLGVAHGGGFSVAVLSTARPAAAVLRVRPAGGLAGSWFALGCALLLACFVALRRFTTPALVGRSGDYILLNSQSRVALAGPPTPNEVEELRGLLKPEVSAEVARYAASGDEEASL